MAGACQQANNGELFHGAIGGDPRWALENEPAWGAAYMARMQVRLHAPLCGAHTHTHGTHDSTHTTHTAHEHT